MQTNHLHLFAAYKHFFHGSEQTCYVLNKGRNAQVCGQNDHHNTQNRQHDGVTKYEVLEMKQTESVDDYKKVIAVSKEKVEYLAKITSDLLTLYRKTHAVHNQRFDLSKLLCEITEDYSALTKDKQISLHLACPQITILADRLLFAQMLRNYIENAIKYNVPNGQIWILVEAKGDCPEAE